MYMQEWLMHAANCGYVPPTERSIEGTIWP